MAATLRPIQALDYVKQMIKNAPIDRVAARILNSASQHIWMAAPWRWSVGVFDSVQVTAAQTDQNITSNPSDFLYLLRATMTDGSSLIDLHIEPVLPATTSVPQGNPNRVAYVAGTPNKFRLYPLPQTLPNANNWYITAWYKRTAPLITPANMTTAAALVMDDEWFHVFEEVVLWKAYQYADDDRAGGATVVDGKIQLTGQRGVAAAGIEAMKRAEPFISVFAPKTVGERSDG